MSVTTLQQNPITKFRSELLAMTPELANALPSHIKPEKFQRVVLTIVQLQPDLLSCDRRSLFAACLKCAADGLIPDGREAALVKYGNAVSYLPMFTGIQKRVRNSGEIASIQSHVVYENDEFIWQQGVDASVVHKPKFPGDRGKPIGVYAIAKFKDGSDPQIEVMDWDMVERIRKVSKSGNNGPWVTWTEEMARKSCFRRLAKWLPIDAETDELMRRDDEAGVPTVAEPTGVVLDGTAESAAEPPDAFEQATRGAVVEAKESAQHIEQKSSSAAKKDHETPDEFIARAQKLSPTELERLDTNAAHKAWLKGLSDEDYKRVSGAIADRLVARMGAG